MPISMKTAALFALLACTFHFENASAFHLPLPKTTTKSGSSQSKGLSWQRQQLPRRQSSVEPLYFWGNKNKDGDSESSSDDEGNKDEDEKEKRGGFLPFFARQNTEKKEEETQTTTSTATLEPPKPRPKPVVKEEEMDPAERAKALRAQAERARLEAEKMDAELTLQKITRLEREMATARKKDDADSVAQLQREMDVLQAKIRGEAPPPPPAAPKATTMAEETASTTTNDSQSEGMDVIQSFQKGFRDGYNNAMKESAADDEMKGALFAPSDISNKDAEQIETMVKNSPGFLKKLLAQMVEVDFVDASDVNSTEVAGRLIKMQKMDFSYSKRPKPTFTQRDIDYAIKEKLFDNVGIESVSDEIIDSAKGNETAKALLALEYNYYLEADDKAKLEKLLEGEDWLKDLVDAVNQTEVDAAIEVMYPKCTRKEDAPLPTMAQVQTLMSDVLPKASFTTRGQPEQVRGGFIVRGASKFESGDETINAIYEQLEKSFLKDKMKLILIHDFTVLANSDFDTFDAPDPTEEPPILYVTGPDILPERRRIALAITTAFGLATSWYLSVYPFLLNPVILKRTEEQLDLADASMAYDLSWLTELSLPLFITFIGIQAAHEAGHKIMGAANGVATTFPTFVPSIITGVTTTVTQFKELPKNKEAMFDISIAGPLCGMFASLAALVVGSKLTLTSDPSLLPALPLDILRQSTLGGGIIDNILGAGALSVPTGAAASQAVAGMTVSLHPVAIAGYIGLILNGLALLPIGTTDGGRVALALFGRGAKPFVGNIFLFTVFLLGILGSDLFLFYFSFLIAFQTGNEIPAKNEVDSVSFPRVLVATGATVLALLTLIPFQQ